MAPVWLRMTQRGAEATVAACLLLLSAVLLSESIELGPGWGATGPQPGFFPFVLTILMIIGTLGVVYANVVQQPNRSPFFEVSQEVTDLLKVGIPIGVTILVMRWLGLYATSGIYLAFFMAWYGKFRWYQALAGGILLPAAMWLMLREAFNIAMPMSVFYRAGILPF